MLRLKREITFGHLKLIDRRPDGSHCEIVLGSEHSPRYLRIDGHIARNERCFEVYELRGKPFACHSEKFVIENYSGIVEKIQAEG